MPTHEKKKEIKGDYSYSRRPGTSPLPVRSFVRNHPSNPTTRIWNVAAASGNYMDMSVHHGLPRRDAVI